MVDVAGGGHVGVALETVHGTYQAPTKYAPIMSESLQEVRTDSYRSPIIGHAVTIGKTPGRHHVEGEITCEALPEVMAYFLIASRWGSNVQKSGNGPYTYTATNSSVVHLKDNRRSLTLVVDRAGVGFAYVGCQVTQVQLSFGDGGVPIMTYSIIGREHTNDYTPGSPVVPTELPFSVDECTLEVASVQRGDVDADSATITLNDNGEPRFNLTSEDRADYVKFGEFIGEAAFEIDFESKADYGLWVARTSQSVSLECNKSANQQFNLEFHGAMYDNFEVALSGLGDQVRAAATLRAIHDSGVGHAATQTIVTNEDIVIT